MARKWIVLTFLAFIFLLSPAFSQEASIKWKTQWNPSSYSDNAYGTCCDENYCYIVGYSQDEGDGDSSGTSVLIAKVDKETGNVVDYIRYEPYDGSADDDSDRLYDCVIVGNYLYAVGCTGAFGDDGRHIVKVDLSTFSKVAEYNYNYQLDYGDHWSSIDSDGTYLYVVGGYSDGSDHYFIVQKLDLDGNVLATYTVDAENTFGCRSGSDLSYHGNEYPYTIKYYNGYVYFGGRYACKSDWGGDGNSDDYDYRTVIVKLNANDLSLVSYKVKDWYTQNFEGHQYEYLYGIDVDSSGVYAVGVYSDGSVYPSFLWKLDLDLNEINSTNWLSYYGNYNVWASKVKTFKKHILVAEHDCDNTYCHQTLRIFDSDLNDVFTLVLDSGSYNSIFSIGKMYLDESNKVLYVAGYDNKPDNYEWTIYALELSGFGVLSVTINYPQDSQTLYVSKFDLNFTITNEGDSDVSSWYEVYLDNNLIYNKTETFSVGDNNYTEVLESFKEGSHTIEVKVWDPEMQDYASDSVNISLDLYDEEANYSNYKEYDGTKYTKELSYEISVRCGVLDHNITISAWNGKEYSIQCDNSTHTISNSYKPNEEGSQDTWFYLNAVDTSDSRYFGNDSFIFDFNPPFITIIKPESKYGNQQEIPYEINIIDVSKYIYCKLFVNSTNITEINDTAFPGNKTYSGTFNIQFGYHVFKVICEDVFYNSTAEKEFVTGAGVIWVKFFDEESGNPLQINGTIEGYKINWSYSFTNEDEIIVEPPEKNNWYVLRAEGTNYPTRPFWLYVSPNGPVVLNAYLLHEDKGIYSTIKVLDTLNNPISEAKVYLKTLSENTVSIILTDVKGEGLTFLNPERTYIVRVEHSGGIFERILSPSDTIIIIFKPEITEAKYKDVLLTTSPDPGYYKTLDEINASIYALGGAVINWIKLTCENCHFDDGSTYKFIEDCPYSYSVKAYPDPNVTEVKLTAEVDLFSYKIKRTFVWNIYGEMITPAKPQRYKLFIALFGVFGPVLLLGAHPLLGTIGLLIFGGIGAYMGLYSWLHWGLAVFMSAILYLLGRKE